MMPHCDDGLKEIGEAIRAYRLEKGRNPLELQELVEAGVISPWLLVCPASDAAVGECWYVYRGGDLEGRIPGDMVIAYDREPVHKYRRNILFAHGGVGRVPEGIFEKAIRTDNRLRAERGLEEKPIGE